MDITDCAVTETEVGEMAAASERVEEYRTRAAQFCQRVYDYLAIMFKVQVRTVIFRPPNVILIVACVIGRSISSRKECFGQEI